MRFFDCSCSVGKRSVLGSNTTEDLLSKMDRYGIEKAIIYHTIAKEHHPITGNNQLLTMLNDRLIPNWVILPQTGDEFYSPTQLVEQMKNSNVKIVSMFPNEHNYSFSSWNCGDIFTMLEENNVPLMLDAVDWDKLYAVLEKHPKLRIILKNIGYRSDRYLYPILYKFKNVFIESSGYKVFFGLETICNLFGSNRIIFGSGMPIQTGAGATMQIILSGVSQRERELIASENLNKLFEECKL